MSAYFSSTDSRIHPNLSSINLENPFYFYCLINRPSSSIVFAFSITTILLLLPLCILVSYVGLQRWRQQRSNSSATMMSHSDIFTYHMVTIELIGVLGFIIYCYSLYKSNYYILLVPSHLWSFVWYGEMFFHLLTCVERYLAVIHPITYLSLRGERGIRIRNISIGCAWLLSLGGTSLYSLEDVLVISDFFFLAFSFTVIFFCSISVLCVLIRPKPGEQGNLDQSKLRAFYTITAILGVLLLRLVWNLIWAVLSVSGAECVVTASGVWFNLPCSLVLPLLFLHRAGIFACRTTNTK